MENNYFLLKNLGFFIDLVFIEGNDIFNKHLTLLNLLEKHSYNEEIKSKIEQLKTNCDKFCKTL